MKELQFTYVVDDVELIPHKVQTGWQLIGKPFKQGSNPRMLQAYVKYYYANKKVNK